MQHSSEKRPSTLKQNKLIKYPRVCQKDTRGYFVVDSPAGACLDHEMRIHWCSGCCCCTEDEGEAGHLSVDAVGHTGLFGSGESEGHVGCVVVAAIGEDHQLVSET